MRRSESPSACSPARVGRTPSPADRCGTTSPPPVLLVRDAGDDPAVGRCVRPRVSALADSGAHEDVRSEVALPMQCVSASGAWGDLARTEGALGLARSWQPNRAVGSRRTIAVCQSIRVLPAGCSTKSTRPVNAPLRHQACARALDGHPLLLCEQATARLLVPRDGTRR